MVPHDDPTDNALAAIASILDQSTTPPEPVKAADNPSAAVDPVDEPSSEVAMPPPLPPSDEPMRSEPEPRQVQQPQPEQTQPIEANGYTKTGPGPMAALRFRWTVRDDGGRYYVDETFGEGSTPLINGPMEAAAAIRFVDDREAEARRRFEHFKQEMISRTAPTSLAPDDDGEA